MSSLCYPNYPKESPMSMGGMGGTVGSLAFHSGGGFSGDCDAALGYTGYLQQQLNAGKSSSYSGSGTTWDDISGNSYDATLVNGVSFAAAGDGKGAPEMGCGTLEFNASDEEYVTLGSTGGEFGTQWSFGMWAYFDKASLGTPGPGNYPGFFNSEGLFTTSATSSWNASTGFAYSVQEIWYNPTGGGQKYISWSNYVSAREWHYHSATYNAGTVKVYIDGTLRVTANDFPNNYSVNTTPGLAVQDDSGRGAFEGSIGEFHFYSNTLTDANVLANYNSHKANYGH